MKWVGSLDRITEDTAYIVLNDEEEHEMLFPVACLPQGAGEGMAYTITIERNEEEEERLRCEIEALRSELNMP